MIDGLRIHNVRGIQDGCLDDLTPLTVLVGPNGCGKSTVVDALHVAAHPEPGVALGEARSRRQFSARPARWLVWRAGAEGPGRVKAQAGEQARAIRFEWADGPGFRRDSAEAEHYGALRWWPAWNGGKRRSATLLYPEHRFNAQGRQDVDPELVSQVVYWDGAPHPGDEPLADLYTRAAQRGRHGELQDMLRRAIPGLDKAEILSEAGKAVLHLMFPGGALPVEVTSDGIHALVRTSILLAVSDGALVLAEEPDAYIHRGLLRFQARAIRAAVARGVQIVLTTHRLEALDTLLDAWDEDALEQLSVQRLALEDGTLATTRVAGPDVAFARNEIDADLR